MKENVFKIGDYVINLGGYIGKIVAIYNHRPTLRYIVDYGDQVVLNKRDSIRHAEKFIGPNLRNIIQMDETTKIKSWVNSWLHNVYGLQDDDLLNAGEVEELLEEAISDAKKSIII